MPPRSLQPASLLLLLPLLVLAAGCGPDEAGASASADLPLAGSHRLERASDPEARELRRLLDLGDLGRALPLLGLRAPELGIEGHLLRARAAQIAGDGVAASRHIEAARAAAPRSAEVCATASELHAAAGRLDTARDELQAGLRLAGTPTPELLRAQGVLLLCRPGGVERGLELLERARREDPELPFCDRALGQAHLLRGKAAMRAGDLRTALGAVRRSLEHDPLDVDARRFHVDALAAHARLEEALAVLEELVGEGHPLEGELASMEKRAAMGALLARDRPRALELFRRARDRGLDAAELGTGARMLAEAGVAEYLRALELLKEERTPEAEEALELALRFEPDYLAARYHMGVLLYQREEYSAAAEHFARVVEVAELEGLALPDPAHISMAHALHRADRRPEACAALERYLARHPGGEYAEATEVLLEVLKQE